MAEFGDFVFGVDSCGWFVYTVLKLMLLKKVKGTCDEFSGNQNATAAKQQCNAEACAAGDFEYR